MTLPTSTLREASQLLPHVCVTRRDKVARCVTWKVKRVYQGQTNVGFGRFCTCKHAKRSGISSNMLSGSQRSKENEMIIVEENDSPRQPSFDRKVSRSRSVGCGSRSFSGDFFERISTGFGDYDVSRDGDDVSTWKEQELGMGFSKPYESF
ncbi:hypothetical protein CTI12_AA299990 [Artemisia annua]|uniref:Uncharacterized protein n=1 Tax=Artemisia annua TaxID=35608 RepID=A0A2U1N6D0_ARTAN|nr:hypothetical protein CTI12_AA299990 [Artemisia annua]